MLRCHSQNHFYHFQHYQLQHHQLQHHQLLHHQLQQHHHPTHIGLMNAPPELTDDHIGCASYHCDQVEGVPCLFEVVLGGKGGGEGNLN